MHLARTATCRPVARSTQRCLTRPAPLVRVLDCTAGAVLQGIPNEAIAPLFALTVAGNVIWKKLVKDVQQRMTHPKAKEPELRQQLADVTKKVDDITRMMVEKQHMEGKAGDMNSDARRG